MPPERILDFDGTFFRGQKSDCDPGQVPIGYYWGGLNVVNIGGTISCRPGHRCIVKFPQGKLQGCAIFRPKLGLEQILVCIEGIIYVAPWPFKVFRALPNVLMSPSAKQIFWQQATQSARRLTTDLGSATEVINPREVLFIQDGSATAPAWYDGSQSGHIRDNAFETPAGGPMSWVGDRLWVSNGNRVFASDIANPFSFREQIYLGGTSSFNFSGDVTGMTSTPSLEFPQLLVFTETTGSIIQANIRQRALWPDTDNMQREVFQVGTSSQRSITHQFGRLSWFAAQGVVFFDAAVAGKLSARIPIRDNEMQVVKARLHEDLSLVAGAAFGQYTLMSVPSDDIFNKHTWVLNNASLETLSDDSGPSWASTWIGTRPVQWVFGVIAGSERIYHVSTDEDGENRLWESFTPDRLDNGCPILWAAETRGLFGQTSQTKKVPGSDCQFQFAEFALVGIEEDLDLGVFYAGGTRGGYKQIMGKRISVQRGSLSPDQEITATTQLFAFKPQSRLARTQDAGQVSITEDSGSCPPESTKNENYDESFQLLIVGHGPAAIRWLRAFAMSSPEDLSGEPNACVNESKFNAVRFDGAGVTSEDFSEAQEALDIAPLARFTANKTAVVTDSGVSAVGVGFSESIVSQDAADRVAEIIAVKLAESEIAQALTPVLSVGEGFN